MSSQLNLEEWVEQRYAHPVVLLESSAAADAICGRHGLDTIQLLRPHSVYTGGPLSSRTGDRSDPITCNRFGVRLMRTDCVRDVAFSQVTRHMRRLMRSSVTMDMAYGEQLDRAIESIVKGGRSRHDGSLPHPLRVAPPAPTASASSPVSAGGPSPPLTLLERACPSWHHAFVRDFHSLLRCSSFDTVDHPVGVVFAVATSEVGGAEGILQVFRAQAKRVAELKASLPGMDNELHQYYLILHDNTAPSSPSLSTARQVLTAVQQLYGANYCALIKVNSVLDPRNVKSLDPSLWVDASPAVMDTPSAEAMQRVAASTAVSNAPSSPSGVAPPTTASAAGAVLSFRAVNTICGTWPNSNTAMLTGCYMSPEDVTEVHNVMAYYLSQSLFKYVERRLRILDVSVQDRRTTTLGKMAAWFKGKDEVRPRAADVVYPPKGSDSSVLPKYVASSLEMQMRHCGDLSLVLHDYEGAITYYRFCIEELLETLSQRPYNRPMIAACQEGIGVAQFLMRRAPQPSLTPWYTGATSPTHRINSQTNRWEVAWNDYLEAGTQTYATRIAFLLYECCRTRSPPMLDRSRAILLHLQRSGILQRQNLLNGVVNDMLAGIAVFSNAPFAAGLAVPPPFPREYPMYIHLRRFAYYLQQAGAFYRAGNSLDQSLRCYLRVLELFRLIDPQETWTDLTEHLYITVGQLYTQLGQDVRGIAMASAAVAQGTPLYRRPATAQQAFDAFWAQQKHVLSNMGYALCPHMSMPRIIRASFHVDRNYYGTDATTDEIARKMCEATAEAEWRDIEKQLKKTYTEAVLKSHPQYRFPPLHGGFHYNTGSRNAGGNGGVAGAARKDAENRSRCHGVGTAGSQASSSAHCRAYDYIFADPVAPGDPPRTPRHYTIARAEPLVLSFVMENTVGCPIEATDLTLLYLSYSAPEQLWKSSTTQTVKLAAGARQRVSLSFDPIAEGEYAIIGLCWSLMGQEGYYYFATRESRPGCPESLYEYAIEHPMPTLEAAENINVTVQPSKACVTATFRPHLPSHLYDGEYFHTKLVLQNTSTQQDATHVFLQRSSTAAHLIYFEEFSFDMNLDFDAPLVLADHLKAQETRTFNVTIRGQHRRGDVALQSSGNYIFMLLAYLPGVTQEQERRLEHSQSSLQSLPKADRTAEDTSTTESVSASSVASPTVDIDHQLLRNPLSHDKLSPQSPPFMVRLHRLLRRCDVQPVLAMFSTVLPPANASLKTAIVLTVKNICTAQSRARPSTARSGVPHAPTNASQNSSETTADAAATVVTSSTSDSSSYTSLRIARVFAVHSSRWGVECGDTEELVADHATQCVLSQGDCLTFALMVKRRSRGIGTADTTARHLFLSRDQNGSTLAVSPYTETICLPIEKALSSPSGVKNVEAHLGTSISQSNRNLFFLQTSCLGPGRIGVQMPSEETNSGLVFYADKAGQKKEPPKSAKQRRRDEVAEERRLCGAAMEQYTPLALAVTWVLEGGDGLREGQLFLFVDPMEHIYQTLAQQQKRQADQEVATQPRPAAAVADTSVEQTQQELCEAMLVRYASLKPWQGAVVSHVHAPPVVKAYLVGGSPTAEIPVTLRCMSLSPVPLLVTAKALQPSALSSQLVSSSSPSFSLLQTLTSRSPNTSTGREVQKQNPITGSSPLWTAAAAGGGAVASRSATCGEVPVLFVGKTVHTFLLMPSEEFEVKFTAHALRPGIVDCQRVTLRAVPLCFMHGNVEAKDVAKGEGGDEGIENESMASFVRPFMRTGMTLPALLRVLLERRAPSNTASATTRTVVAAHPHFENGNEDIDEEDVFQGDSRSNNNFDHWKTLTRPPRGPAEGTAVKSVKVLAEYYGARAAEVIQQLSPRGPAASASVSQIIPQTAPTLTRVVLDSKVSEASSSASPSHAHEAARKFFRQLEAFEAEVLRAGQASSSSGSPVDPFLHQYVYRPTVKSIDIDNTSAPSSNTSLALAKSYSAGLPNASSVESTLSVRRLSTVTRFAPPRFAPRSSAKALFEKDNLVVVAAPHVAGDLPPPSAPSPLSGQSFIPARPALVLRVPETKPSSVSVPARGAEPTSEVEPASSEIETAVVAASSPYHFSHNLRWENHGSANKRSSFADAFANEEAANYRSDAETGEGGEGDGDDPASPLHIPTVAFERRATEAAETLDIGESGTFTRTESRQHQKRSGDGVHMHTNSLFIMEQRGLGDHHNSQSNPNDTSLDSAFATNTVTRMAHESLSQPKTHAYGHDFTDTDSVDETRERAYRHLVEPKAPRKALLVPSAEPLSPPRQKESPPAPQFQTTSSSSSSSSSSSDSSSTDSARGPQHPLA